MHHSLEVAAHAKWPARLLVALDSETRQMITIHETTKTLQMCSGNELYGLN